MSVLTVRGAGVRRRRQWLFRDFDVTVDPGDLVAVTGPPGSGRTTGESPAHAGTRATIASIAVGMAPCVAPNRG